ncbi:glycosyltransferase involved in cell wall biosynthesis [Dyadobacter jejuensis]|uniref:Glycosyltransferase involved in cell wall biosynthesis n=1 Tax=Dyadobacter jejuensis TaxID=1082580 RepID=A0A316AQN9_9BACT|nr:glycosyltransferase family 2 protein [Dyadobacter jejuensis]PWJ59090.1 glycosyltransferase involved in cell wall biosynthesis [Dyadobacter jejuensis]
MKPLVSIALCTFNGQAHLKPQLETLLQQSYSNLEIIVIDDASTDDTYAILLQYAAKYPHFKVYRNERNKGYNRNFEQALQKCSGDLIAICDQDDLWHPKKIEKQVEAIQGHQLIYHDSELIDAQGKSLQLRMSQKFNFYRGTNPAAFLFINCVSGHSIMLKRTVLDKALPFPNSGHYDQWLAFVAASQGSIDYLDEALVYYRQHDSNATDILATKSSRKSAKNKVAPLLSESNWLKTCRVLTGSAYHGLVGQLYQLSASRNRSYCNLQYAGKIWWNRTLLLPILKKNALSKFFYCLRKSWGVPMKRLL